MICTIILVAFFLRALPRLIYKNALNADTYFHLYCAYVIRGNKFRLPVQLPRAIVPHQYNYPFFYHLLLSLFSPRFRTWAERLSAPVFDTANLIILYLFTGWAIQKLDVPLPATTLPLTAVLYALSPALFRFGSGPGLYSGSPRVLGQTLYFLHIFSSFYAFITTDPTGVIVSLLTGAILIVTAKFGGQVLIFFGLFFALLISYQYLFLLFGSLVLSLVMTGGWALRVIKGHINHSIFYFTHLQWVFPFPHQSLKGYIDEALQRIRRPTSVNEVANFGLWYLLESYPLHVLIALFSQFLLIPLLVLDSMILQDPFLRFLLIWMGAGFFWFIFTKNKRTLFLGDGERYLEYALFPSLLLGVLYLQNNMRYLIYGFLVYSIVYVVISMIGRMKRLSSLDNGFADNEIFFEAVGQLPEGVIWPIGSLHHQAVYRTLFPVLTNAANLGSEQTSLDERLLVFGNYPYASGDFTRILNTYDVTYILTSQTSLDHYRSLIVENREQFDESIELILESPTLVLFKVREAVQESRA